MTDSEHGIRISRSLTDTLSLTVARRDPFDADFRRLLNIAVAENSDSRGFAELNWLYKTIVTANGVAPIAFLAQLNDVPVGMAIVLDSPERVLICALHVQSHARGVGVGSSIVHAVRGVAAERHLSAFALPGDRSTKNLYEQLGMPAKVILAGS